MLTSNRLWALGHAAERVIFGRELRMVVYHNDDNTDDYAVRAGEACGPPGFKRYAEAYAGSSSDLVVLRFYDRARALGRL